MTDETMTPKDSARSAGQWTPDNRDHWLAENAGEILKVLHYARAMLSIVKGAGPYRIDLNFEREEARLEAVEEIVSRYRAAIALTHPEKE